MKVLFWNTHKNLEIDSYLYDFVEENTCDIIILAEYDNSINGLCNQLSLLHMDFYPWEVVSCDKIRIISGKNYRVRLLRDELRYCIYDLESVWGHFLLAGVHLPSKIHSLPSDIEAYARRVRDDIEREENKFGHRRTLVVGDFNANPFEDACINADCFHALPNSVEAKRGSRTVSGIAYTTFYNPMWNLFGDFDKVGGSYFYSKGHMHTYQWNIYDQVIIRPELIGGFVKDSLKIVKQIKHHSLLDNNGRPNKKISDHLPIYFEIKEGY